MCKNRVCGHQCTGRRRRRKTARAGIGVELEKNRDYERATAVLRETNRWLKRKLKAFQGSQTVLSVPTSLRDFLTKTSIYFHCF